MRTFKCRIVGATDLVMRRFTESSPDNGSSSQRLTPEEEAEQVVFRNPDCDDQLFVPGIWLQNSLRSSGKKYGRDYRSAVPAAAQIVEEEIFLFDPETERPVKTYNIDARSVVIPNTGERVMRYRPRLDSWAAEFHLNINERILPAEQIKNLMIESGEEIGLGEMRPQFGGPFGLFAVTKWREA